MLAIEIPLISIDSIWLLHCCISRQNRVNIQRLCWLFLAKGYTEILLRVPQKPQSSFDTQVLSTHLIKWRMLLRGLSSSVPSACIAGTTRGNIRKASFWHTRNPICHKGSFNCLKRYPLSKSKSKTARVLCMAQQSASMTEETNQDSRSDQESKRTLDVHYVRRDAKYKVLWKSLTA